MSKPSRKGRRGNKRNYTPLIIVVLVLILGVVAYYIYTQSGITTSSPLIGKPVPDSLLSQLSGVTAATLNAVGPGPSGLVPLQTSTTAAGILTLNGKPEVLYIGAEYCPYCAAERWVLITALDKFGNFTGIEYMQSAPAPEVYPNTSTFTFVNAAYTSKYITFVPVEQKDRSDLPLMTASANETALMTQYDKSANIPFVDFANQYTLTGSQYLPPVLRVGGSATGTPYNWTEIASQLNTPSSVISQNINGAANKMIAAICKIDGNQPVSVCNQTYAQTVAYIKSAAASSSQLIVSDAVWSGPSKSVAAVRLGPTRSTDWA